MLLILLIAQVWAAGPTSLVRYFPSEVLANEVVEFTPVKDHHFSIEAPQNCGSGVINEKNPRIIKCQFSILGQTQASLNVCDDKKTYCRPLQLKINVTGSEIGNRETLTKNEQRNKKLKHALTPGFILGSVAEITKLAAQKNQPVFVMISTDWCPPCNEAKEFLLSTQAFQAVTEKWIKVYVDGDSLGAMQWNEAMPFHYFPSFIFLSPKMQEIGRFTGEIRQTEFANWAKLQATRVDDPILELKARVMARRFKKWGQKIRDFWDRISPAGRLADEERLLAWAFDRDDDSLSRELIDRDRFPSLKNEILHFQLAELEKREQFENIDLKSQKISLYKMLLEASFKGEHWSANLQTLCETDVLECKKFLDKIPLRVDLLERENVLYPAEKESRMADEYYYIAEIYQTLKDKVRLKHFAAKCIEHFDAMRSIGLLKISRAGHQGMVACLELSEDFKREEKTLNALIEAYPEEQTFLWRMARMQRKQKKNLAALVTLQKAEKLAYGYNWFTLQILKAELYLDLKKPGEARKVLDKTLAEIQLDTSRDNRNQGLVARLRVVQSRAGASLEN